MPLQWSVSHPSRLVLIVAKGVVQTGEMMDLLAALDRDNARPYRKICDISGLESRFPDDTIHALAAAVRAREQATEVGPLAIVATNAETARMARLFIDAAELQRPIQLFDEQHLARRWLDRVAAVLKLTQ
jgi:signal transduction histidine kinase